MSFKDSNSAIVLLIKYDFQTRFLLKYSENNTYREPGENYSNKKVGLHD